MLNHGHVYHCGLEEYQLQFNLKFSENVLIFEDESELKKKTHLFMIFRIDNLKKGPKQITCFFIFF